MSDAKLRCTENRQPKKQSYILGIDSSLTKTEIFALKAMILQVYVKVFGESQTYLSRVHSHVTLGPVYLEPRLGCETRV